MQAQLLLLIRITQHVFFASCAGPAATNPASMGLPGPTPGIRAQIATGRAGAATHSCHATEATASQRHEFRRLSYLNGSCRLSSQSFVQATLQLLIADGMGLGDKQCSVVVQCPHAMLLHQLPQTNAASLWLFISVYACNPRTCMQLAQAPDDSRAGWNKSASASCFMADLPIHAPAVLSMITMSTLFRLIFDVLHAAWRPGTARAACQMPPCCAPVSLSVTCHC